MEGATRVCRQGRVRKTSELFFFSFFLFLMPVKETRLRRGAQKVFEWSQEAKEIEGKKKKPLGREERLILREGGRSRCSCLSGRSVASLGHALAVTPA